MSDDDEFGVLLPDGGPITFQGEPPIRIRSQDLVGDVHVQDGRGSGLDSWRLIPLGDLAHDGRRGQWIDVPGTGLQVRLPFFEVGELHVRPKPVEGDAASPVADAGQD